MDKQIFDVEIWGNYTIQVEASSYDEARRLGLVAYRKHIGSVEGLDFFTIDEVITKVSPSSKRTISYV
mgnify:CR=1 FL=1